MIACTSPAFTERLRPFRIGLSATVAWRFSILSISIGFAVDGHLLMDIVPACVEKMLHLLHLKPNLCSVNVVAFDFIPPAREQWQIGEIESFDLAIGFNLAPYG